MSKSVMIIDTPIDCCDCPFGTMAFGKSVCLLDEGNGIECPLKPYKDYIPIEWIKKWCLEHYPTYPRIITEELLKKTETWQMIEDWEKENETN